MPVSKKVIVTKSEFVDMIYSQVGEKFTKMLKEHEKDPQNGPLANLDEQNAACRFFGINMHAKENVTPQEAAEDSERVVKIRIELTRKIIGLYYDILSEDLAEITDGRNADVNLVPDNLMRLYSLKDVDNCPLESEGILSRMCYLLDKYSNQFDYSADRETIWHHMKALDLLSEYVDENGHDVSQKIAESFHLPNSEAELLEALTQGIPERCRIKDGTIVSIIDYDKVSKGTPRYKFKYPDTAQIIARMYAYRNGTTHKAYWSAKPMEKKFMSVSDMVLTGMIITAKYAWPLFLKMLRREDELIGATAYCKGIVENYETGAESRMFCNFKWNLADNLPPYAQGLGLTKNSDIKNISVYLWRSGLNRANLLQGVAGCGKTWAMRKLEYEYARDYLTYKKEDNAGMGKHIFCPLLPVYIPMIFWYREITDDSDSIINVLTRIIIQLSGHGSDMKDSVQEGVKQLLKDGRFLVIFDGVDECPYGDKPRIYRSIEGFISDYFEGKPSNLCLISDRDVSTENQANMVSYAAAPINKNDVAMYVNRFIENNPQEAFLNDDGKIDNTTKNDLIKKVVTLKTPEKISTVFELAQLTMIASTSDEKYKEFLDKSEDKRAVALNRYYLMALLEREAKEKLRAEGGDPEDHYDALCEVLSNLSNKLEDEDITGIDRETLMEIILEAAGGDRKLSKTYRVHLVQAGLLREYQDMMDIDRKWYYSFINQDIQEAAARLL